MKIKKEYIILGIIIIGLSVYLYLRKTDRTLYELPQLPEVGKNEITKLEIIKDKNPVVLTKKDNKWYIDPQGFPADNDKVKSMLDIIEDLTLTMLVSESKNYSRYDLSADKKIQVKAGDGNQLRRDFDIGKAAPSFRHTFVKLAGDDRVFHARENFRNRFDLTVDNLRDKTVLSFKTTDIQEIQISKDKTTLAFIRSQVPVEVSTTKESEDDKQPTPAPKTVWKTTDGRETDEAKLNRLLSSISNLRCEKYFNDDRKKEDFQNPLYHLQLKGAQEYILSIFEKLGKDDKQYPAVSSENNYPFLLSESQANRIMQNPDDLIKKLEKTKSMEDKKEDSN